MDVKYVRQQIQTIRMHVDGVIHIKNSLQIVWNSMVVQLGTLKSMEYAILVQ